MKADKTYVLDSYAILAYLDGEEAAIQVTQILTEAQQGACRAAMSVINLGEVLYITEREKGLPQAHEALAMIEQLALEILPASRQIVLDAAHIKANYPVSYADAFVIATALELKGVVVTGDTEFDKVKQIVQIEWIPNNGSS